MSHDQTNNRADPTNQKAQDIAVATAVAAKPCESGAPAKKKKLSLDIEEIGEVLERKISP
jgi:hypothetical protein